MAFRACFGRLVPVGVGFVVLISGCGADPENGAGGDASVDAARDHALPDASDSDGSDGSASPDRGVSDGDGGTSVEACLEGVEPVDEYDYVAVVDLTRDAGDVRLSFVMHPHPDLIGTSGTIVYEALRGALERDGVVHCLNDPAALHYMATHHNCNDSMSFEIDGTTYTWRIPSELVVEPPFGPASMLLFDDFQCDTSPSGRACFGGPC